MAAEREERYESALARRYAAADSETAALFSERRRVQTWRQLWAWLALAQSELGVGRVTAEQAGALAVAVDAAIDWAAVAAAERRLRHDVMAHIEVLGSACPAAADVVHLGATSAFVVDNADLILCRRAIDVVAVRLARCLHRLGAFAERFKTTPTVGRTHLQAAALTTVGKRAAMWADPLIDALADLRRLRDDLKFRGVKGATGTQDTFLELFAGDADKVRRLDERVAELAGFGKSNLRIITGQTYSRLDDFRVLSALAAVGAQVHKTCADLRMLQADGEVFEPFEESQVGSSAMPYKRNPMRAERVCSLARWQSEQVHAAWDNAALNGFERTLDDSASRRLLLPDAFVVCEALLSTFQNVLEGLRVDEAAVGRRVAAELPFLALEKVLVWLTERGDSRQRAHALIRRVALDARGRREAGGRVELADLLADDAFAAVRADAVALADEPRRLVGLCVEQVDAFRRDRLLPALLPFDTHQLEPNAQLNI